MRKYLSVALLSTSLLGIPMLVGCDDKTSTSKETKTTSPDGSSTVDKQKTTTDANGNSTTTTEHKSNNP